MKSQQFNICQSHFAEMALENFTKHFRKPNLIRMRLGWSIPEMVDTSETRDNAH